MHFEMFSTLRGESVGGSIVVMWTEVDQDPLYKSVEIDGVNINLMQLRIARALFTF